MAKKKLRKVPTQNARKDSFCGPAPSALRRSRKYLYVLGIDCCRYALLVLGLGPEQTRRNSLS